jgi:hypothetical protein
VVEVHRTDRVIRAGEACPAAAEPGLLPVRVGAGGMDLLAVGLDHGKPRAQVSTDRSLSVRNWDLDRLADLIYV